jgi:hypothetical protein
LYIVCEEVEDGWMTVGDECIPVTLECEDAEDINFHNVELVALGDFVWDDQNQDGIQDAGELGIADVTVNLYACNDTLLATTTTDASGYYLFDNLVPGDYKVEFILPSGYVFSPQYQGGDPALDSNADTTTGFSECVTLTCEDDLTIDAGMYVPPGNEGCTPGYWKNNAINWEASAWIPTGYTPSMTLGSVFTIPSCVNSGTASNTLLQALSYKGGSTLKGAAQILLRAAVAALLNASHPDIDYFMSEGGVIAAVNAALASCDRATILALYEELDFHNNDGCVLDMHGDPIIPIVGIVS